MASQTVTQPASVDEWIAKRDAQQQEQIRRITGIIHAAAENVAEAIKWRRLTFTIGGDWHHWLCAIAASKGGVSLVFHKGALLNDPARVFMGDARYLRQVPYGQVEAHSRAVAALIREAIAHQTDMLDE